MTLVEQHTHGSVVGKYRILGELGTGGMGVVYLAEDTSLNREVAIKSIRGVLAQDDSLLRRFEAEARAVGKLFHPHIVPINALTREGDVLYIEMPYLSGGSLDALMEKRNLQCPEVVLYCAEILDALAACHQCGLVHRDVKPSNILLDQQGRALLGDFGLAKVVGEEMGSVRATRTASSFFVGTPRYAPLEAWDDRPPTPAWDLYSIGVILFEGVAGRSLYDAHSLLGHMRALEQNAAPALTTITPQVSPDLSELVGSLLEARPAKRLSDAREARNALMRTPEYKRLECSANDTMTLARRTPKLYVRKLRYRMRLHKAIGLALLTVLLLSALFFLNPFTTGANPGETARTQRSILALPDYNVEHILQTRRFSPGRTAIVFREVMPRGSGGNLERWLVISRPGGPREVLAMTERRIALLSLSATSQNDFDISGYWGEHLDNLASDSANGTVLGQGRWLGVNGGVYASLEYTSTRQGIRWTDEVTFERTRESDTQFLWELEETPDLALLMGNELPGRESRWASLIPKWLPAIQLNLTSAPAIPTTNGPLQIDASLGDWKWHSERAEALPGWPDAVKPEVRIAYDKTGLYLAFRMDRPLSGPTASLCVRRVIPHHNLGPAPVFHFPVPGARARAIAGTGQPPPRYASKQIDGHWQGEVFLPLEINKALPEDPRFFRINLQIHQAETGGEPAYKAVWGAPNVEDISHGILVRLLPDASGDSER